MTILSVIQSMSGRTGIPVPPTVFGSTDPRVGQLAYLAAEIVEDLLSRYDWQVVIKQGEFSTLAQEDQGTLLTICGVQPIRILNDTLMNRTMRLPVYGPINDRLWQQYKALPNIGPFYKYRIRGNRMLFNPVPPAGQDIAFEFITPNAVIAEDGTEKAEFTADSDTFALDERLLKLGLRWKWKAEKGQDYAEELSAYAAMALSLSASDATKPVLLQDGGAKEWQPGIFVPLGNWSVP